MIHDERCVRLQESGGAKPDHDADSLLFALFLLWSSFK
jgi:hypothetical protein